MLTLSLCYPKNLLTVVAGGQLSSVIALAVELGLGLLHLLFISYKKLFTFFLKIILDICVYDGDAACLIGPLVLLWIRMLKYILNF